LLEKARVRAMSLVRGWSAGRLLRAKLAEPRGTCRHHCRGPSMAMPLTKRSSPPRGGGGPRAHGAAAGRAPLRSRCAPTPPARWTWSPSSNEDPDEARVLQHGHGHGDGARWGRRPAAAAPSRAAPRRRQRRRPRRGRPRLGGGWHWEGDL
ncbi:unnamed protein product, partial [Prorocentrum cordatum]